MMYRRHGKRMVDVMLAVILLPLVAPLILAGWMAVRFSSAGPGFFRQERVGLGGQRFRIHKLRTMSIDPERVLSQTGPADPEVLPVGRLLRKFKLDETPQILNVLRGDMSLVGPRPCMPVTVAEMPSWAQCRFDVRPGLTGLAQVNGNIALSWEERWRYDLDYVAHCSLLLDAKILAKTLAVVVLGEKRFRRTT